MIITTCERARQLSIRYMGLVYDVRGQRSAVVDPLARTYRESRLVVIIPATAHRVGSVHCGPGWVGLPVFPAWLSPAITAVRSTLSRSTRRRTRRYDGRRVGSYFTVARRPQINAWLYNVEMCDAGLRPRDTPRTSAASTRTSVVGGPRGPRRSMLWTKWALNITRYKYKVTVSVERWLLTLPTCRRHYLGYLDGCCHCQPRLFHVILHFILTVLSLYCT